MKNKKYRFAAFSFYDYTGIQKHYGRNGRQRLAH